MFSLPSSEENLREALRKFLDFNKKTVDFSSKRAEFRERGQVLHDFGLGTDIADNTIDKLGVPEEGVLEEEGIDWEVGAKQRRRGLP